MNWAAFKAETELLLREYKALRPVLQGGIFRPEYWENDYEAKHRFDTVIDTKPNGARFLTNDYKYKPIRRI